MDNRSERVRQSRRLRCWRRDAVCAVVVALLAVLVCGCSSQKPKDPLRPKIGRADTYVTGIAAAFYCTCERWPRTWYELNGFDDALHALAKDAGKAALPRFAWSDYPDARVATSSEEGYLTIDFGPSKATVVEDVAVPFPDCSHFDRTVYVSACPAASR